MNNFIFKVGHIPLDTIELKRGETLILDKTVNESKFVPLVKSSVEVTVGQTTPSRESPWVSLREAYIDPSPTHAQERHNLESCLKRDMVKQEDPAAVSDWEKCMRHSEVKTILAGFTGPTYPFGSKLYLKILSMNDSVQLSLIMMSKFSKLKFYLKFFIFYYFCFMRLFTFFAIPASVAI